jgi:hypothetical protein
MNKFGFIAKEGIFTHVEAEQIHDDTNPQKQFVLDVANDTSASAQPTSVALNGVDGGSVETIPKGSIIKSVQVKVANASLVDPNLAICVGYFSDAVSAEDLSALLSQRVFAENQQLTGACLTQYGSVSTSDLLEGDKIALMNKVQGITAPLPPKGFVQEPIDLVLNVTVLKGTLSSGALNFIVTYC